MTKVMTALLATALFIPAIALAQDASQSQDQNGAQQKMQNQAAMNQVAGMNTNPHQTMTGMVSNGGKTFTSDNVTYQVSNPGALKNYDNQNVTIKAQFNTDKNSIKVNKVNPGQ